MSHHAALEPSERSASQESLYRAADRVRRLATALSGVTLGFLALCVIGGLVVAFHSSTSPPSVCSPFDAPNAPAYCGGDTTHPYVVAGIAIIVGSILLSAALMMALAYFKMRAFEVHARV